MTGTIELLPVGAFGVDDSFGPPSLADMLTLGVQFESRYIAIDNALTHDKLWTKDRIKRNADHGILAMVNYEQSEGTTLGGDTAGRKHGPVAGDWRAFLEMPDELAIVISTDVGVTRAQYSAISDFCAAFSETGGGKIGHYHGTTLCAHLEDQGLNDLTWMAMATSWSPGGETPAVHVRQKGYVLGSCDANYVRQPTPFWNFNGQPQPPPPGGTMEYMLWPVSGMPDTFFYGAFDGRYGHLVEPIDLDRVNLYRSIGIQERPPTAREGFTNLVCVGSPPPGFDRGHFRQVLDGGTAVDAQAIINAAINQVIARLSNG